MTEPVQIALIASVVGPAVLVALNKMVGRRRESREDSASVAAQWQAWSTEQTRRIDALEQDVIDLKKSLAAEQLRSASLQEQNRRQATMLTALIRWAILLRDEVIRMGGKVPPAPVEIETAMTTLEP